MIYPYCPCTCSRQLALYQYEILINSDIMWFRLLHLRSVVTSRSVCVLVRVVRAHTSKTTRPNLTKFMGMLPVARSSSVGVAIYVTHFRFCG